MPHVEMRGWKLHVHKRVFLSHLSGHWDSVVLLVKFRERLHNWQTFSRFPESREVEREQRDAAICVRRHSARSAAFFQSECALEYRVNITHFDRENCILDCDGRHFDRPTKIQVSILTADCRSVSLSLSSRPFVHRRSPSVISIAPDEGVFITDKLCFVGRSTTHKVLLDVNHR